MLTATLRDDNGVAVGGLVLMPKTFKSGSVGLFGSGKLTMDGERYQVQCQLVQIGSKPQAEAEAQGEPRAEAGQD